ncbi:MAG: ABC transporter ATP-binding protein [Erysipelotrichaceae bacterium]|nr:ABC transporter ATP-binding protein [Erysipelotrichaceae bacterium]
MKKISKLGLLLIIISALIGTSIPYVVSRIIDGKDKIFYFIDNGILLVILFLVQAIFSTLANFRFVELSEKNAFILRNELINKILKAKLAFLDKLSIGKIPSHIDNNIKVIQNFYAKSVPNFISAIFTLIISLIFLFSLDLNLTILLIILLPIIALIIVPITMLSGRYADLFQKENSLYIEKLSNIFNNVIYIKTLNAEEDIINDLTENNQKIRVFSTKNNKVDAFVYPFLLLALVAILAIIFMYGGLRVSQGYISVGVLIAYLLYIFQLLTPVSGISSFFSDKERSEVNYEELKVYLELKQEEDTNITTVEKIEKITFDNVSFGYDDEAIIEDLNLAIKKGEKIAVVGESGSGKSTMFKLLMNLYSCKEGNILINDQNINKLSLKSLRDNIAFIPQENSIIYSKLGKFLALSSDEVQPEKIVEIFEALNLKEKFNLETLDLDSVDYGLGGKNLSTGQKQRILIAKALISKFSVLLMDESTSAVDSELENKIFNIVDEYCKDKIMISIAHRLSTVKYVDRVIFFEDGKITGDDTHENLYRSHEKYQRYIDLQNINN